MLDGNTGVTDTNAWLVSGPFKRRAECWRNFAHLPTAPPLSCTLTTTYPTLPASQLYNKAHSTQLPQPEAPSSTPRLSLKMPARIGSLDVQVLVHRTASDLLAAVESLIVPKREREANVFLPHARKLRYKESLPSTSASSSTPSTSFWLSLWSTSGGRKSLDVVLACTEHHLGEYPIFLYSHHPVGVLSSGYLALRVPTLVDRLADLVSASRVFSVFGELRHHL